MREAWKSGQGWIKRNSSLKVMVECRRQTSLVERVCRLEEPQRRIVVCLRDGVGEGKKTGCKVRGG